MRPGLQINLSVCVCASNRNQKRIYAESSNLILRIGITRDPPFEQSQFS